MTGFNSPLGLSLCKCYFSGGHPRQSLKQRHLVHQVQVCLGVLDRAQVRGFHQQVSGRQDHAHVALFAALRNRFAPGVRRVAVDGVQKGGSGHALGGRKHFTFTDEGGWPKLRQVDAGPENGVVLLGGEVAPPASSFADLRDHFVELVHRNPALDHQSGGIGPVSSANLGESHSTNLIF